MGVIQTIKDGLDRVDQKINPFRQIGDVLEAGAAPGQKGLPEAVERVNKGIYGSTPVASDKTPQQVAYEAKTDAMNAQNPYYKPGGAVPRAKGGPVKAGGAKMKGGPVKAGGAKMKNVDNSGLKKEPC